MKRLLSLLLLVFSFGIEAQSLSYIGNCSDPICGAWQLHNKYTWVVEVRDTTSFWEDTSISDSTFTVVMRDPETKYPLGYTKEMIVGRYNKVINGIYFGETMSRDVEDGSFNGFDATIIFLNEKRLIQIVARLENASIVGHRLSLVPTISKREVGLGGIFVTMLSVTSDQFLSVDLFGINGWIYLGWTFFFPLLAMRKLERTSVSQFLFLGSLPPLIQQSIIVFTSGYDSFTTTSAVFAWCLCLTIFGGFIGILIREKTVPENENTQPKIVFTRQQKSMRSPRRLGSTGTGFVVSSNYVVTASHVINDGDFATVRHNHEDIPADLIATDRVNDLALLLTRKPFDDRARLRSGKEPEMGESIATYGYPLHGKLNTGETITEGVITAVGGLSGRSEETFQFSAPTQYGNSGGPVLDRSGNVIGVVVHSFGEEDAQLVNFAVKWNALEEFLIENRVRYQKRRYKKELALPGIRHLASKFTVPIHNWEFEEPTYEVEVSSQSEPSAKKPPSLFNTIFISLFCVYLIWFLVT